MGVMGSNLIISETGRTVQCIEDLTLSMGGDRERMHVGIRRWHTRSIDRVVISNILKGSQKSLVTFMCDASLRS